MVFYNKTTATQPLGFGKSRQLHLTPCTPSTTAIDTRDPVNPAAKLSAI